MPIDRRILRIIFIFSILVGFVNIAKSQPVNYPLGKEMSDRTEHFLLSKSPNIHTGFKPIIASQDFKNQVDTALYLLDGRNEFYTKHKNYWLTRKLFFDDFVSVEKKQFKFYVNPLLNVESGQIQDSVNRMLINTRGIEFKGEIGTNVAFYSSFYENYSQFRPYIHQWSLNRLVVPGQGAHKSTAATAQFLDYSMATSYLSYAPTENLKLQLGYGKHFVGEGYRSMLLSDNAFNYPYLRADYQWKDVKYTTVFAEFQDFATKYYFPHTKKHSAFNYLSYNFLDRIELGIFEGAIYQTNDTANYVNKFSADYFVPIIGVRTLAQQKSRNHNILAGANLKIKLTKGGILYAQYASDLQGTERFAWQAGVKFFDVLHGVLPNHKLFFQAEFNKATSSIYTHDSIPYQSWTHYNQELAHPFGTRFDEFVVVARYSYARFYVEHRITKAETPNSNDIYISQSDLAVLFPLPRTVNNTVTTLACILNPRTDMQLFGGIHTRTVTTANATASEPFVFFGIRTCVNNFYYDF